ncbi:hypothetical protein KY336_02100 [Candidatus Woesearchaeota archaeon]|nr:hypothetical protein [Candidatus Woesearchaeota archaeon]
MTEKTFNSNETRSMVLDDIRTDLRAEYQEAVEEGRLKEVKPPALEVKVDGNQLTIGIPKMTPAERHVALQNIDEDSSRIKQEHERFFPNELPLYFSEGKVKIGKGHFTEIHKALVLKKTYVPEEEQEATMHRLAKTITYHIDTCSELGSDYSGLYIMNVNPHILSEEWDTLQDFRAFGRNDHMYVQAEKKFHSLLKIVDQLIEADCAKSGLEILAVLRRINNDIDEEGQPLAGRHFNGKFDYHLYHAGKRIYSAFVKNPGDFKNLTPWQYEVLVDAATQYEFDRAEDANRAKDSEHIQELADKGRELDILAEKAEETRIHAVKEKEARQAIANCIANHYLIMKAKETKGSVSNA